MNCREFLKLMEEYIMDKISPVQRTAIENHLEVCKQCRLEYEKTKALVQKIRNIKNVLRSREDIGMNMDMNKKSIVNKLNKPERRSYTRLLPGIAACVFFVMFVFSGFILAFPSLACRYIPEIPLVKELSQTIEENSEIRQEIEAVKMENEQLKMEIKKIKDIEVNEVTTSEGVSEEEDRAVQELVVDFIKAQYRKDIDALKQMSTDEFKKQIDRMKQSIFMGKGGEVVFTQITNVAKDNDIYYVFVRLNDSAESDDADFQENFEVVRVGEEYLVSFVGLDA